MTWNIWRSGRFAFIFIGKIIVFALVYWGVFFLRPDAYNFISGYNSNPVSAFLDDFYTSDETAYMARGDTQRIIEAFRQKGIELDRARAVYLEAELQVDALEAAYYAAISELQGTIEAGIQEFERQNIEPLEAEIRELRERVDSLPLGSAAKPVLLQRVIELNESILAHHEHILANRRSFGSQEAETALAAAEDILRTGREAADQAGGHYRSLRGEVAENFSATRGAMLSQIGILDFLYFSACISTTTTFGDITANNNWVRGLVVLQILSGIMILTAFLNSIRFD